MYKKNKKSVTVCFKRWARKNWAVFASFHRVVKIGVLSVSMSILTLPFQNLLAQADTTEVVQKTYLKEVLVVTQRANPTRGVVLPTEVFSRNKMETSSLQTIENALKINPVVDLRERGAKGVQADISLYGGTADQTMVMLNGINFTDARTGHQSHSLPIDIEGVNGINLIGGVPGIGAFTGAINIITSPVRPNYLRGEISGGQYGYLYGNISGAITREKVSAMIIGSVRRGDGYIANTDFNTINLYARVTYDSDVIGILDFQSGYQRKFFGANGFYSLAYPNQAEHTETYLTSLKWKKQFLKKFSIGADVSYRRNTDRFELFRGADNAPSWYKDHNYHLTDNVGVGINGNYDWIGGTTSIGADYTFNHILSNVLGDKIETPIPIKGEVNKFYTNIKGRNIVNGWVSHSLQIEKWNLSGSFNYGYSPYGNAIMWSGGIGYDILPPLNININAAHSVRLPTFTDLYYTTKTHTGNISLSPEKATTYRLSLIYNGSLYKGAPSQFLSNLSINLSGFFRQGKDIIDWVKKYEEDKWESMQITSLNTFGAEVSIAYSFKKVLRNISASYGYIHNDKNSNGYISKYALDYLKNKVSLRTNIQIYKTIFADISGTWFDRNGKYQNATGEVISYTPFWLVDARLSYRLKYFTFFVNVNNVLNVKYFDFGGLVQPGIWADGGIRIDL